MFINKSRHRNIAVSVRYNTTFSCLKVVSAHDLLNSALIIDKNMAGKNRLFRHYAAVYYSFHELPPAIEMRNPPL